jgi:hypothetical protein
VDLLAHSGTGDERLVRSSSAGHLADQLLDAAPESTPTFHDS